MTSDMSCKLVSIVQNMLRFYIDIYIYIRFTPLCQSIYILFALIMGFENVKLILTECIYKNLIGLFQPFLMILIVNENLAIYVHAAS